MTQQKSMAMLSLWTHREYMAQQKSMAILIEEYMYTTRRLYRKNQLDYSNGFLLIYKIMFVCMKRLLDGLYM